MNLQLWRKWAVICFFGMPNKTNQTPKAPEMIGLQQYFNNGVFLCQAVFEKDEANLSVNGG